MTQVGISIVDLYIHINFVANAARVDSKVLFINNHYDVSKILEKWAQLASLGCFYSTYVPYEFQKASY